MTGSSESSPPSPMISGGVLTNETLTFFFLFGFGVYVSRGLVAALLTSEASGHLCAADVSIRGAGSCRVPSPGILSFSVDGLRKSTTSSLRLNFLSEDSFFRNSFPHLEEPRRLMLSLLQLVWLPKRFVNWKLRGRRDKVGEYGRVVRPDPVVFRVDRPW
jgi:hypothetical protein